MGKKIFREKTVEKLSSPEDLTKFIRIANPGIWIIIVAVVVFLIGAIVWGTVGRLETKVATASYVDAQGNVGISTYIAYKDSEKIKEKQILRIEGQEFTIDTLETKLMQLKDMVDDTVARKQIETVLGWKDDDLVFAVHTDVTTTKLEAGYYKSVIVTGSVSPLSFIFN